MLRKSLVALFCFVLFASTGCVDSHEKVMQDQLSLLEDMVTVLEKVETKEDANAAQSKIERLGKRIQSIELRTKRLGKPSPELKKKLEEKYRTELQDLMGRMVAVMFKSASNPELKSMQTALRNVKF